MTYLETKNEIEQKMSLARVSNAECEVAYTELILDMAREIDGLKDENRRLEETLQALKLERSLG